MGDDNILGMYVLRELHVNIGDEMDYNMPRKKKSDGCPNHCPLLVLVHERLLEALRPAQHPREDTLVIDLLHVRHAVAFEMLCKFLPWNLDAILQERAANKFPSCLALGKMDPATFLCPATADLPRLLFGENLVQPPLLHDEGIFRAASLSTSPSSCFLIVDGSS